MKPHVIVHNAVSLNGLLTGFDVNMGLYYRLAGQLACDADLVGSGTIVAAPESGEVDDPAESFESASASSATTRSGSLLVIADGRGRVKCWGMLQRAGFWGDFASLACEATPPEHLEYLQRRGVHVIVAGSDRIDLSAALEALANEFSVHRVRVDSGGTLNAALLNAGLVDEISLLVQPVVVPDSGEVPLFGDGLKGPLHATLTHEERFEGGEVWLRYDLGEPRE